MNKDKIIPTSKNWILKLRIVICLVQVAVFFYLSEWSSKESSYLLLLLFSLVTVVTNFLVNKKKVISEEIVFSLFCLDLILLSINLSFTGGASNPFSIFFLIYVIFSSLLIKPLYVWAITGLSLSSFGILLINPFIENTSHHHGHISEEFNSHLLGMWIAYVITSIFSAYFVTNLAAQLKKIYEDKEILKQGQLRLSTVVRLSAGAAHELSTPLNTMRLLLDNIADTNQDLIKIKSQADRCYDIIKKINPAEIDILDDRLEEISLSELINEIKKEHNLENIKINFNVKNPHFKLIIPKSSIILILKNLISNSIHSTEESNNSNPIEVCFDFFDEKIEFLVKDFGVGFNDEIISKIGEPFISTKNSGKGLGLGLFIVDLTIKRFAGSMDIKNNDVDRSTTVKISLPYPIKFY